MRFAFKVAFARSHCYSMGLTLHQHSHSHGGGSLESHSHDEGTGRSSSNINVRAAYIHVLGDIIQSLGVLIAAVIVYFRVSIGNYIIRANTCWIRATQHVFCLTIVEYLMHIKFLAGI